SSGLGPTHASLQTAVRPRARRRRSSLPRPNRRPQHPTRARRPNKFSASCRKPWLRLGEKREKVTQQVVSAAAISEERLKEISMAARLLHVTSPLITGADVLALQQKLKTLGYDPGVCDGAYGPTTAGAVKAFQRVSKVTFDGVVGPGTRKALSAAKAHMTKPPARGGRPLGQKAL